MPVLLLFPLYSLADRFIGGGLGWAKLKAMGLRGRGSYYVGPLLLAASYALGGWPLAAIAAIWLLYRSALGFWNGTLDGRKIGLTLLRHAVPLPLLAVVALAGRWPV